MGGWRGMGSSWLEGRVFEGAGAAASTQTVLASQP